MTLLMLMVCAIGIVTLLWIEARANPSASVALWVPTVWALLGVSGPPRWISPVVAVDSAMSNQAIDGNIWNQVVLGGLTVLALLILATRRNIDWSRTWREHWRLFLLFAFVGLSAIWSDVPYVSARRWIRDSGVVVMGLVVMSEAKPLQAFESVFRRCAYVLIPLSLALVYFVPSEGRSLGMFDDGTQAWTGVTSHKNLLGLLCAVSAFMLFSALTRRGPTSSGMPQRQQKWADIAALLVSVYLLIGPGGGAYSATSIAITVLGVSVLWIGRTPRLGGLVVRNLKAVVVVLPLLYFTVGPFLIELAAELLGRDPDLTGRTTIIWPVVMAIAADHPILGTGWGAVWHVGGDLSVLTGQESAHNGYLEIYLQLGMLGCVLLALLVLNW